MAAGQDFDLQDYHKLGNQDKHHFIFENSQLAFSQHYIFVCSLTPHHIHLLIHLNFDQD